MERFNYVKVYDQKRFDIERRKVLMRAVDALRFWSEYLEKFGPVKLDPSGKVIIDSLSMIEWDGKVLPPNETAIRNCLITANAFNEYGINNNIRNPYEERYEKS